MSKLTSDQQIFVTQQLACFRTPTEVKDLVKKEFEVDITRQAVEHYDPNKNPQLDDWLKTIFSETRASFMAGSIKIGITYQSYRLQALQDMFLQSRKSNPVLAAQLLEQAAKEMGGAYTNKRELTGAGGNDLVIRVEYQNSSEHPSNGQSIDD